MLLFFVPLCSIDPILGEQQEEEEEEQFNEMDYYFYSEEPDASPIVEYMAPHEDWNETCPDFIYEPKKVPGIRIVEFYAHWWCVYCRSHRRHGQDRMSIVLANWSLFAVPTVSIFATTIFNLLDKQSNLSNNMRLKSG